MTENEVDIRLLQDDPHALILKYQKVVRNMVARYVHSGLFKASEFDDAVQSVNLHLLSQIHSMQRNYTPRSRFVTYLSAVIRNSCLRQSEIRPPAVAFLGHIDPIGQSGEKVFQALALAEAVDALEDIVLLFHDERPRLTVLLRLHFKMPLTARIILLGFPKCRKRLLKAILEVLGANIGSKMDHEIYDLAAPFLNRLEGSHTSGDGYRHWFGERIPDILRHLRTRLDIQEFTTDDLRLLVERMGLQSEDSP